MVSNVHSWMLIWIKFKANISNSIFFASPTWDRKNMYDSAIEYWITVRERGSYEEEHEIQESKRSKRKVPFH